jgi:hypothetical protein
MSRSKEKFNEYSPVKRLWIVFVFLASLGLVAAAERDIQRRPADQVRGGKSFWRLVCLNALGAAGYLRWGRRSAANAADR